MPKTKPNVFDGQTIAADEFLKTHWQRAPYLFRNTNLDLSTLPDTQTLFKLAAQEGVQSRIVYTDDELRYQAIYDEPEAWDEVTNKQPTLLVSDIEKWHPPAMKLLQHFPFIKSWRFDDLMMSYAPEGASVGAHTDHYDVFLVQVQGRRRWSYDDQPLAQPQWVMDSELAVLKDYQPEHSHELQAGDVLYLPPGIPHHGISTSDDCVTCSIGLRAPSKAELLMAITELASQDMAPSDRFKDAVDSVRNDAAIGSHEINYLRQLLSALAQQDDQQLATLFGQYITGYRLLDEFGSDDMSSHELQPTAPQQQWQKSPFSVFAYHATSANTAQLFVNGEVFDSSLELAQTMCNQLSFSLPTTTRNHTEQDQQVVKQLIATSALTKRP